MDLIKKEKGQASVEFALVAPILILLFALMVDFGQVLSNKISMESATAATSRWASIHYSDYDSIDDLKNDAQMFLNGRMDIRNGLTLTELSLDEDNNYILVKTKADITFLTGLSGTFTRGNNKITLYSKACYPFAPDENETETDESE